MIKFLELPSQEELNTIFHYNKVTGDLVWKTRSFGVNDNKRGFATRNIRFAGKIAGTARMDGRRTVILDNKTYWAHRVIYKMCTGQDPKIIDHIDQNPGNNRIDNLRDGSQSNNCWNGRKRCTNTSGYKGVTYSKQNKKWAASLMSRYKRHFAGYHDTPEEAFMAACKLRRKLHGEFACDGV